MAQRGKCRSCRQPVLWVKTVNDKPAPLDPEPHEDGNVVRGWDGRARFLRKGMRQCIRCGCSEADACPGLAGEGCAWVGENVCSSCVEREPRRYVSHFATCSNSASHRKLAATLTGRSR